MEFDEAQHQAVLVLERHDETSKDCTATNEKDRVPRDVFPIGEPNGRIHQVVSLRRKRDAEAIAVHVF